LRIIQLRIIMATITFSPRTISVPQHPVPPINSHLNRLNDAITNANNFIARANALLSVVNSLEYNHEYEELPLLVDDDGDTDEGVEYNPPFYGDINSHLYVTFREPYNAGKSFITIFLDRGGVSIMMNSENTSIEIRENGIVLHTYTAEDYDAFIALCNMLSPKINDPKFNPFLCAYRAFFY
jgi:hypothetical protein